MKTSLLPKKKKPSLKQLKAMKLVVENGGNISKAMRDAGYSPETAKSPSKLTESLAWQDLMEKHFSDAKISKIIDEGLKAMKENAKMVEVPDHATRHKFVETALKLKSKFPAEKHELTGKDGEALQIEITDAVAKLDEQ